MATMKALLTRANAKCELCGSKQQLEVFEVSPAVEDFDTSVLTCAICREQMAAPAKADPHHWRCLNDAMWSDVPAIKVLSWRMLGELATPVHDQQWARDQLEMLYLDDETLEWAKAGSADAAASDHKDCHGSALTTGCTVTLVKDLNVKGAGFTAKRGTAVRNISLVADNDKHIEGRINGQQIVILTEFVKRSA